MQLNQTKDGFSQKTLIAIRFPKRTRSELDRGQNINRGGKEGQVPAGHNQMDGHRVSEGQNGRFFLTHVRGHKYDSMHPSSLKGGVIFSISVVPKDMLTLDMDGLSSHLRIFDGRRETQGGISKRKKEKKKELRTDFILMGVACSKLVHGHIDIYTSCCLFKQVYKYTTNRLSR